MGRVGTVVVTNAGAKVSSNTVSRAAGSVRPATI